MTKFLTPWSAFYYLMAALSVGVLTVLANPDFALPDQTSPSNVYNWVGGISASILLILFAVSVGRHVGTSKHGRLVTVGFGLALIGASLVWSLGAVTGDVSDSFTAILMLLWSFQISARVFLGDRNPTVTVQEMDDDAEEDLIVNYVTESMQLSNAWPRADVVEFTSMILRPELHRGRVTEVIELDRHFTQKCVDQIIHHLDAPPTRTSEPLSAEAPPLATRPMRDVVRIPVLHPKKGQLHDNMKIELKGSTACMSLSHQRSLAFFMAAIFSLYQEAYGLKNDLTTWEQRHLANLTKITSLILQPAHRLRTEGLLHTNLQLLEECFPVECAVPSSRASSLAMAVVGLDRYSIIVETPRQEWYHLVYEYVLETRSLIDHNIGSKIFLPFTLMNRIRESPRGEVRLPLVRASKCSSFHLEVTVPTGSYIGATSVENEDGTLTERSTYPQLIGQSDYVRLPALGQPRAHLYLRASKSPSHTQNDVAAITFKILEKPLGSDALAALWLIVVVGFSAVLKQTLASNQISSLNLLAFSLAFPLMLTTAVTAFSSRTRSALNVSPSAIALSFLGALLLCWEVSQLVLSLVTRNDNPPPLLVSETILERSIAVGLLALLVASAVFTIRAVRYMYTRAK